MAPGIMLLGALFLFYGQMADRLKGGQIQMLNFENLSLYNRLADNRYNIPEISPEHDVPNCEFIGFNYVKTDKYPEKHGVHFYLDDYQFQRVWNNPDAYTQMLKKYKCVLSPDYSMYTDMPIALQIYNHYRKHWLASYWQRLGIKVVSTICWSTPDSYKWCFDGEPHNSVVSVSSVGCMQNKAIKAGFIDGYKAMTDALNPSAVIFFGNVPDEIANDKIIKIDAFQAKWGK